jgi:hypothetical protein
VDGGTSIAEVLYAFSLITPFPVQGMIFFVHRRQFLSRLENSSKTPLGCGCYRYWFLAGNAGGFVRFGGKISIRNQNKMIKGYFHAVISS